MIASATVVAFYGVFQYFYSLDHIARQLEEKPVEMLRQMGQPPDALPDVMARVKDKRVFSTFTNPNSLAGFLLMSLAVSTGALIDTIRRRRNASSVEAGGLLLALIWQGAALVLTFSKGGFVTLAVMAAAFAALTVLPGIVRRHRGIVIAGAIVLALAAGIGAAGVISHVAAQGFGEASTGTEGSLRVRLGYWAAAGRMIIDHPLQGVGLGNFGDFYSQYKLAEAGEVQRAHNNYLQVAAEMGIPGLIVFCVLWGGFLLAGILSPHAIPPSSHHTITPPAHLPITPPSRLPVILGVAAGLFTFVLVGTLFGTLETFAEKPASVMSYVLMAVIWLVVFVPGAANAFQAHAEGAAPADYRFTRIGIAAGIAGFLVHGLADFDLYVPGCAQTAWLLAALALVLREPGRGRSSESASELPAPSAIMGKGRQLEDSTCPYSARPTTRIPVAGAIAIVLPVLAVTMLLIAPGSGLVTRSFEAESLAAEARHTLRDEPQTEEKLNDAAALLERSLAANPLDDETWYLLGQAHESLWHGSGRKNATAFHEAIRCFRKAVELDPGYSAPLYRIALAYRQAGLFDRGLLLQRVPWGESGKNTIELAAEHMDATGADRSFLPYVWAAGQAVASYPTNPHFRAALGEAYYLAGLKQRAAG
ncbi:MAG TPA: O-antigen ligase family protein, partial [Planctomycetota bacterium]|nr:O-antigen ligase family protein [Planctomycetota bacterium]